MFVLVLVYVDVPPICAHAMTRYIWRIDLEQAASMPLLVLVLRSRSII